VIVRVGRKNTGEMDKEQEHNALGGGSAGLGWHRSHHATPHSSYCIPYWQLALTGWMEIVDTRDIFAPLLPYLQLPHDLVLTKEVAGGVVKDAVDGGVGPEDTAVDEVHHGEAREHRFVFRHAGAVRAAVLVERHFGPCHRLMPGEILIREALLRGRERRELRREVFVPFAREHRDGGGILEARMVHFVVGPEGEVLLCDAHRLARRGGGDPDRLVHI